jgi:glutamyl-tRNA reductase
VKEAYATAQASGTTGAVLNRVFQKAFQAAKHVRTHTGISSGTVSVANVAVDLAANIFGSLANAKVLILGTGEIGEGTARAFKSRGAADLAVAGRRPEKAAEVASGLGAGTVHFDERDSRIADFDIVVCSTAAPEAVLTASAIAKAMKKRPARPLLVIDLALPRDVESSAADLQNVFLYNLDDLAKIAEVNRTAREEEIGRCKDMLAHRADSLWTHVRQYLDSASSPRPNPAGRTPGAAGHVAAP